MSRLRLLFLTGFFPQMLVNFTQVNHHLAQKNWIIQWYVLIDDCMTTPTARWPGLIKMRVARTRRFSQRRGISLAAQVSAISYLFKLSCIAKIVWAKKQWNWRRLLRADFQLFSIKCAYFMWFNGYGANFRLQELWLWQITLILKLGSEYWKCMIISINTRTLVSYRHRGLTPHCHEHRKEHCAVIIEQQAHLKADKTSSEHKQTSKHSAVFCKCTGVPWHMCRCQRAATLCISCHTVGTWPCRPRRPPFYNTVSTLFITVHMFFYDTDKVELWGNLHEGWAVEEGKAIEEDYDPNKSGRDEQICVPAQPQVIQGHLLTKVVPDMRTHTH